MNKLKLLGIASMIALLGACSSNTYKIKTEKVDKLTVVPSWYMANINDTDACDLDTNLIGQVKKQ